MSGRAQRELIHKVNNLLSVIYTQVEVGRAAETREAALTALERILRVAQATVPFVRAGRAELDGGEQ
jgi:hypothetical protein